MPKGEHGRTGKHNAANTNENIHIPRYIREKPWFYKGRANEEKDQDDYLKHHRQKKKNGSLDIDNNAEPKVGAGIHGEQIRTVTHSGAVGLRLCKNCGSSSHTKKDCLERPRKPGSAYASNSTVEVVINKLDEEARQRNYDAKKDRWFGYTGREYDELLASWKNRNTGVKKSQDDETNDENDWDTDEEIELLKLGLYKDANGILNKDDARNTQLHKTSVRLREDKAHYLKDIYSTEINYDPKSRLYKSNDLGYVDDESKMFHRHVTGEGAELVKLAELARERALNDSGNDAETKARKVEHVLVANPTKYEKLLKNAPDEHSKVVDMTSLEAKKSDGTARNAQAKRSLDEMYGSQTP